MTNGSEDNSAPACRCNLNEERIAELGGFNGVLELTRGAKEIVTVELG